MNECSFICVSASSAILCPIMVTGLYALAESQNSDTSYGKPIRPSITTTITSPNPTTGSTTKAPGDNNLTAQPFTSFPTSTGLSPLASILILSLFYTYLLTMQRQHRLSHNRCRCKWRNKSRHLRPHWPPYVVFY